MKKYSLKTKLGERIVSVEANDIEEAYDKLEVVKNLPINSILNIFNVEEDITQSK